MQLKRRWLEFAIPSFFDQAAAPGPIESRCQHPTCSHSCCFHSLCRHQKKIFNCQNNETKTTSYWNNVKLHSRRCSRSCRFNKETENYMKQQQTKWCHLPTASRFTRSLFSVRFSDSKKSLTFRMICSFENFKVKVLMDIFIHGQKMTKELQHLHSHHRVIYNKTFPSFHLHWPAIHINSSSENEDHGLVEGLIAIAGANNLRQRDG